ncbi:MAG: HNH endonuclease [Candidatus Competibacter sp.]
MRLTVDFSELLAAVAQMGADRIEPQSLRPFESEPLDPIDLALAETGIDVDLNEIDTTTGLLVYRGRQVLLYIKEQGSQAKVREVLKDGSCGNKYHVAFCEVLSKMNPKDRLKRYVATNDISGEFLISGFKYGMEQPLQGKARLQVCRNCLKYLNYRNYQKNPAIFRDFSLTEFFGGYTPDWPQISAQYRADKEFRCEQCGVNLSTHRHLLHTHHRNRVKTDNRPDNFQALCLDCHRHQPAHDFMPVRHEEIQLIIRLRGEQLPSYRAPPRTGQY